MLQSMGLQKVKHDLATEQNFHLKHLVSSLLPFHRFRAHKENFSYPGYDIHQFYNLKQLPNR